MAKVSVCQRQLKREKLVVKYAAKRKALKAVMQNEALDEEVRIKAQNQLQKLPRDSSAVRLRNRCYLTGRPRGVYSRFGLARTKLREHAMAGDIPGLVKASW